MRAVPRREFWTRTSTAQDIHEIYDLRGALEVLALCLAAPRLSQEDLQAHLEALYAIRAELEARPVIRFLQVDIRFHTLITRASRNGRLIHSLSLLRCRHLAGAGPKHPDPFADSDVLDRCRHRAHHPDRPGTGPVDRQRARLGCGSKIKSA